MAGQVYGRLTLLKQAPTRGKQRRWVCRCTCGKIKDQPEYDVITGRTTSCGCLMRERNSARMRTHGMTHTRVYQAWLHMKQRCYDPNTPKYPHYGGRGIEVCARWRFSFENFLADMGERPSPHHSLDRIDGEGHYTPENCRWATYREQWYTRRDRLMVEHDGRQQLLAEWAREYHIQVGTVRARLRYGWSMERALSTPARFRSPNGHRASKGRGSSTSGTL